MALLTFDRIDEVFIYYGIFDFREFNLNTLKTKSFKRLRNKHLNDLYVFHVLIDVLEKNKDARKKKFKQNAITSNQIEFYKKILGVHNVDLKVRDELIRLIQCSNLNDSSIKQAISSIDSLKLLDKNNLKNQAQILLFFLSKSYLNSELFTLDWQEAKKSNKIIYLLLLEPYIDINHLQCDQTKIFKGFEGDYYVEQMIFEIVKDFKSNMDDYYKDYSKEVFLSYSRESEAQIDDFLKILTELDWNIRPRYLEKCDLHKVEENISKMKRCDFVIFCLTNVHLQSEQLKQEFEVANSNLKLILPILFENINENNRNYFNFEEFKMTKLYDSSSFKRFQSFLSRALGLQKNSELLTCNELKVSFSINAKIGLAFPYYISMISNHEIIFRSLTDNSIFKKINIQTGVIKQVSINLIKMDYYCWIKHLNNFLYGNRNQCMVYCELSNESKDFTIEWFETTRNGCIEMIEYNSENYKTYLLGYSYESNQNIVIIFDEHLQLESTIKISNLDEYMILNHLRVSNNYVYLWESNDDHIYVFDSKNFNYLTNFKSHKMLDQNVFFYSHFVLIGFDCLIQIVDSRCFETIGFIKTPGVLKTIIGNKLIVKRSYLGLYVGKIEVLTQEMAPIDSRFMCKINPSKPHVYFNPYFLPCGNSACIECICDNFNIFRNFFKCCFENCKEEHRIINRLEKNTIIEKNLMELVEIILTRSLKLLKKSIVNIDVFEARFDYTLKLTELRVESVKLEIDGIANSLILRINSFERKLKDTFNQSSTLHFKINCYKKTLTKFNFGQIGDDYNDIPDTKLDFGSYYDDNLFINRLTKALTVYDNH